MKYPHFKVIKPIIAEAFLSNKYIQSLKIENLEKDLDFEITGIAQNLFEEDIENTKLQKQLSIWFSVSYPEKKWNSDQFIETVSEIKEKLKKIENV